MEFDAATPRVAGSVPSAAASTSPATAKNSNSRGSGQKRCHNVDCSRPDSSRIFYSIGPASKAGGRNWAPLCGMTLCEACYETYRRHGTLKKSKKKGQTLSKENRKCANRDCKKPQNVSTSSYPTLLRLLHL